MDPTKSVEVVQSPISLKPSAMWPLWLFLAGLLLIDFALITAIHLDLSRGRVFPPRILEGILMGLVAGQVGCASIIGGVWGRTWLAGILAASALISFGFESHLIGRVLFLQRSFELPSHWKYLSLPLFVLTISSPLMLCRFVFGWQLVHETNQRIPRVRVGVEDLFMATAAIASILSLHRIANGASERNPVISLQDIAVVSVLVLANLVGICPAVYLAFRVQSGRLRWLLLCGFAMGFVAVCVGAVTWMSFSQNPGAWFGTLWVSCLTSVIAVAIVLIGLGSFLGSGFGLARYERSQNHERPQPALAQANPARVQHRWCVASLLTITLLAVASLVWLESFRKNLDEDQVALHTRLGEQGGGIAVQNRKIVKLKLGRDANDEELRGYYHLREIYSLGLADTHVTDAIVPLMRNFPKLTDLDLSRTMLSETALRQLGQIDKLETLSLAGLRIAPAKVPKLIRPLSLFALDLSDLAIGDDDLLHYISPIAPNIRILRLRDNKFTDAGFKSFLNSTTFRYPPSFDLSGNALDGSGLDKNISVLELILDDVPLTDVAFGQAIPKIFVSYRLALSNTRLTDSFLPKLGPTPSMRMLELGDGNFTEDGLIASGMTILPGLALTGQQFTGRCFDTWHPRIEELKMSGSGLTDETVGFLANVIGIKRLRLAKTAITDTGLRNLFSKRGISSVHYVNLSHTQVTADGILSANLPARSQIVVAIGQFTTGELRRLKAVFYVYFEISPW